MFFLKHDSQPLGAEQNISRNNTPNRIANSLLELTLKTNLFVVHGAVSSERLKLHEPVIGDGLAVQEVVAATGLQQMEAPA